MKEEMEEADSSELNSGGRRTAGDNLARGLSTWHGDSAACGCLVVPALGPWAEGLRMGLTPSSHKTPEP